MLIFDLNPLKDIHMANTNLNLNTVWADIKSLFADSAKTGPLSIFFIIFFVFAQYLFPLADSLCSKVKCEGSIWIHQPILIAFITFAFCMEFRILMFVLVPRRERILHWQIFVTVLSFFVGLYILHTGYQVYSLGNSNFLLNFELRKSINWCLFLAYYFCSSLTLYYILKNRFLNNLVKVFDTHSIELSFISLALQSKEELKYESPTYDKTSAFSPVLGIPYKVWVELINRKKSNTASIVNINDLDLKNCLIELYSEKGFGRIRSQMISNLKFQQARAIVELISEITIKNGVFE